MKIVDEFKEFAIKGNALDMAVGIILGAAFNNVVNAVVNHLLMPPIGFLIGGVNFADLKIVLKEGIPTAVPPVLEVAIGYGLFINSLIQFFITAVSAFFVIKVMNMVIRKRETEAKAA